MKRQLPLLLSAFVGLSAFAESTVLRTASDLAAALQNNGPTNRSFDLTATVSFVSTNCTDEATSVAVNDASGSIIFRAENRQGFAAFPRRGAVARCRGTLERDIYNRTFAVLTAYDETAIAAPPEPVDLSRSEILDRQHDSQFCRFSGTLRYVVRDDTGPYGLWLSICTREGRIFATVPTSGTDDCNRLIKAIGAEVSISGICTPYDYSPRIQTGRVFKIAATDFIKILPQSSESNALLPTVESIRMNQPSDVAMLGRHRASGHIVAAWLPNRALLKTANGDFISLEFAQKVPLPRYGTPIEAVGLPESDLFHVNLINVSWRALKQDLLSPEPPVRVSPKRIIVSENGNRRVNCGYHGHAITLSGVVRSISDDDADKRLYVESESCIVPVNTDAVPGLTADLSVGSQVEVTGTCVVEIDVPHMNSAIPSIRGFFIAVRTPRDMRLLTRPSWWTTGKLLALVCTLFAALLVFLIWNFILRRLVEKRGRELSNETIARATSDLKVYERTRLAVELHDTLAQNLTGVSMEIDTAEILSRESPGPLRDRLVVASRALKSCRDELRNCLWDMRHEALDADNMESAIQRTLAPHISGVDLAVRFPVPRERISDTTTHTILRIVRELTINAVRHGKATSVMVAGSCEGQRLLFSVYDNGCGFDPDNCPGDEQGHYGLLGIRERVNSLDGSVVINSVPGKGTKATIRLKIPGDPKDRQ